MDWIFTSCYGQQTSAHLARNSRKTGNRMSSTLVPNLIFFV
jgi:hypothetical protein